MMLHDFQLTRTVQLDIQTISDQNNLLYRYEQLKKYSSFRILKCKFRIARKERFVLQKAIWL